MIAAPAETLSLVRCYVGDQGYGVDVRHVASVARSDRLRPDPSRPEIAGLLPTKKGDVPTYSLASLLGRPAEKARAKPVLLIEEGADTWGLLVDRISQSMRIGPDEILPVPRVLGSAPAHRFGGVVRRGDETLLLLAPERLRDAAPDEPEEIAPAAPTKRKAKSSGRVLLFGVGDASGRPLRFAVGLKQVAEIAATPKSVPIPGASPVWCGMMHWRERTVPVLDLASALGLEPLRDDPTARALVVRATTRHWIAVLAKPTMRLLPLPTANLPGKRPDVVPPEFFKAAFELSRETVVLLDFRRLLSLVSA